MKKRSLSHLSDASVSDGFLSRVAHDHPHTADLLEYLGEYDDRKLWAREGYPSMFAYCVEGLHMSDDVALVRIRAARACRDFPALFEAVAEGRLHLTAVLLLKPHLKPENVDGLVAAATQQTKTQIERLLAERYPRPDVPTLVHKASLCSQVLTGNQLAPERVETGQPLAPERVEAGQSLVPERVEAGQPLSPERVAVTPQFDPERVEPGHPSVLPQAEAHSTPVQSFPLRARVTPLAPERYALQVTISQGTHDKLRRAQELLSHALPSGNVAEILDRAFDSLIHELEKRKFAATSKPRANARASENPRHIPAQVKRAVMARDEGRCTFVSDQGRRCSSRKFLQFDHVTEVARGGTATVSGIRMRCRAHNQYTAECAFGPGLMDAKRRAAAEAKSPARAQAATEGPAAARQLPRAGVAAAVEKASVGIACVATRPREPEKSPVGTACVPTPPCEPEDDAVGIACEPTVSREPEEAPSLEAMFLRARRDEITRAGRSAGVP